MQLFTEKVRAKKSGIFLYGITPPKANCSFDKAIEISQKVISRIQHLEIDGLVIYDLQDEAIRNENERPFPFASTLDPFLYASEYLQELQVEKIIYKSVSKNTAEDLSRWVNKIQHHQMPTVFVGAPSKNMSQGLKLSEAYDIWKNKNENCILGGVAIPERHSIGRTEHFKINGKMEKGCSFFISQCVYNSIYTKNVLSDLYYNCEKNNVEMPTFIFTLTTCGSIKTLDFMKWLGIDIPVWLQNELYHSKDILLKSIDVCLDITKNLVDFCISKSIPFGINVESVSVRTEEIEASIYLLEKVKEIVNVALIDSEKSHPNLLEVEE